MTTPVTVSVAPPDEPAITEPSSTVYVDDGQPSTSQMALQTFTAAAAPPLDLTEPITLAEAKEHLRVVTPDDDAYITSLIVTARTMAEGKLNRTIVQRRRVARFSDWGDRMRLLKPPVISVDNVGYYSGDTGTETVLGANEYYAEVIDEDGITQVVLAAAGGPTLDTRRLNPIVVYYTAGYVPGEVPASIVQWIKLAMGTMYNNRETIVNGTISQALGDDFVRWLLQPHMVFE